jgi:prevent-host-death family protein
MDVAVSKLRAELSGWIEHVRNGGEIVVTDRGVPVARIMPIDSTPLLERLVAEGVISKPKVAKRPITRDQLVKARGSVSDFVGAQRR